MSKRAVEKFINVSEVLQPSPSAKMAWRSNFTIVVFSLYSDAKHWLLALDSNSSSFCFFAPLCLAFCLYFVMTVMCWLCSANPGMKQWDCQYSCSTGNDKLVSTACVNRIFAFLSGMDICTQATSHLNCIPKQDSCLHTSHTLPSLVPRRRGGYTLP